MRVRHLLRTAVLATASLAVVAAGTGAASAVDTTPTVQLVVAHVRFVSLVSVPQVGAATDRAFDTGVAAQQSYYDAREDESGNKRVPLTTSHPSFHYDDANFIHDVQFSFSGNAFQWSTRLTPSWQSMATGPVTETTYWYVNGGRAQGGGHVEPADYHFHGSFAARPGDNIDMANDFTFECGPDTTCNGTFYVAYEIAS